MRLGKKLGVVHDPRTFKLDALTDPRVIVKAPREHHVVRGMREFPLFANDRASDCTFASHGHRIAAHEASARQRDLPVTDKDVLDAYFKLTGGADDGAYMLDVLNVLRHDGLGRERDGTPHTIDAYIKIDHVRRDHLRYASWHFGGLFLGLWLPLSAQNQDEVWDVLPGGPVGAGEPGSWGGHAVYTLGYDAGGIDFVTWGSRRRMTWNFVDVYCDEAYAVISEDYLRAGGTTPQGFNVDQLRELLAALK